MPLSILLVCKVFTTGISTVEFVRGKNREVVRKLQDVEASLGRRLAQLQASTDRLQTSTDQLQASTDRLQASTDQLQTSANRLQAAADQQVTREILGAFEAMTNAAEAVHDSTRERYLRFAEETLLRNTNLNPHLQTADKPNSEYIALVYSGLSSICLLREEQRLALKHILQAFRFDPKNCRAQYAPQVFDTCFREHCEDLDSWYETEEKRIQSTYHSQVDLRARYWRSFSRVPSSSVEVEEMIPWLRRLRIEVQPSSRVFPFLGQLFDSMFESLSLPLIGEEALLGAIRLRQLDWDYNSKLDRRCQEIANTHLAQLAEATPASPPSNDLVEAIDPPEQEPPAPWPERIASDPT